MTETAELRGWAADIVQARESGDSALLEAALDLYGRDIAQAYLDALDDQAAHVRGTTEERPTYPMPAHGWTCFHCGETFRTPGGARRHFGATPVEVTACTKSRHSPDAPPADMSQSLEDFRKSLKPPPVL